ncbi:hypothetical protein [Phenylobacterium montanum]|uniref:Lipoprotein n=1 Tax=Phenylobacterium montanum TaxID=2823693 RepID=A0A975IWQ8_9CAUL|nr:hypothetical protein [Caulobacter sp. S6]QUD88621.1 hypothetical protein KCG34_01655 [Caulobacter sp. S6]
MTALRPCLIASAALLALLGGCRAPKPKAGAASAESHAPGTTLAQIPAACAAYPAGSPGVVRTFCSGPAVVKLTINGAEHVLKGGSCETSGNIFSLNLGVVAGPGLAGPAPDYVGLTVNAPPGPFNDAALSVHYGGKAYLLPHNTGQATPAGGEFSGVTRKGHAKVSAVFTC